MRIECLHALRVKRPRAGGAAARKTDGDGTGNLRAPVERGRLIDNLVEADRREIRELHLNDRAHALNGRPNGRTNDRVFAERRIEHPARIFLRQTFGGLESAAELADILPVDVDAR